MQCLTGKLTTINASPLHTSSIHQQLITGYYESMTGPEKPKVLQP